LGVLRCRCVAYLTCRGMAFFTAFGSRWFIITLYCAGRLVSVRVRCSSPSWRLRCVLRATAFAVVPLGGTPVCVGPFVILWCCAAFAWAGIAPRSLPAFAIRWNVCVVPCLVLVCRRACRTPPPGAAAGNVCRAFDLATPPPFITVRLPTAVRCAAVRWSVARSVDVLCRALLLIVYCSVCVCCTACCTLSVCWRRSAGVEAGNLPVAACTVVAFTLYGRCSGATAVPRLFSALYRLALLFSAPFAFGLAILLLRNALRCVVNMPRYRLVFCAGRSSERYVGAIERRRQLRCTERAFERWSV